MAESVASDVVGAGAALAGLTLVFIGHTAATYHAHPKKDQPVVKRTYQWRAGLAFVGFVLSLLASVSALIGKWKGVECLIQVSVYVLCAAAGFVVVTAMHTGLGIRSMDLTTQGD
jgi:hypothetical protein